MLKMTACFQWLIWLLLLFSKNNIQQAFQKFHVLLKEEFSPEDIQIIACPSMEQVIRSLKILVTFISSCLFYLSR